MLLDSWTRRDSGKAMPPQPGLPVHDHDCGEGDCGVLYSLYKNIDLPRVQFLPEAAHEHTTFFACQDTDLKQRFGIRHRNTAYFFGYAHESAIAQKDLAALEQVSCLNENSAGSCRSVFKPWEERTDFSGTPLQSCLDDDPELLLHIPFTNREDLDFGSAADMQPVQEFTLNEDPRGLLEYPVTIAKFQNLQSLDMLFPESLGADHLEIFFVGIKGERTSRRREAVQAVYEVKPMADAKKVPGTEGNTFNAVM